MAIASIAEALAQCAANPPSTWGTDANAAAHLDAVDYILKNRALRQGDQGSTLDFESLQKTWDLLSDRLSVSTPRARGRSRLVGVAFSNGGGIQ